MQFSSRLLKLLFFASLAVSHAGALAQTYPTRTVRIVVAYPAGGGNDMLARLIAAKMTESWGQQVIVDNRPGAAGNIGTAMVAKAAPDGHTLLIGPDGSMVINSLIFSKLPYETMRDFELVTRAAESPLAVVSHPSLPARSIRELVALAKARPGQLNIASGGLGSTPHLAAELLKSRAGIDVVHVPYKGGGQAVIDVLGGQMPLLVAVVPTVQAYVDQGRLRALGVTSARRSRALPDVRTVAESGFSGFDVSLWWGVVVPKGTPAPVVLKLQTEIVRILGLPDVKVRLATLGIEPIGSTPDEFTAKIKSDTAKWSKIVTQAGIKAD